MLLGHVAVGVGGRHATMRGDRQVFSFIKIIPNAPALPSAPWGILGVPGTARAQHPSAAVVRRAQH